MERHFYQTKLEELVFALFLESATEKRVRFTEMRANYNDSLRNHVFVGRDEAWDSKGGGRALEIRDKMKKTWERWGNGVTLERGGEMRGESEERRRWWEGEVRATGQEGDKRASEKDWKMISSLQRKDNIFPRIFSIHRKTFSLITYFSPFEHWKLWKNIFREMNRALV